MTATNARTTFVSRSTKPSPIPPATSPSSTTTRYILSPSSSSSHASQCANCFNDAIPGCSGGGLGPGQIVGITVGAATAAAIAMAVAAYARKSGGAAAGSSGAGQTPVANTSPIYRDPVNAGVMPEGIN